MKILIAEDEHDIAVPYKIALEKRNHEAVITHDGEECLKAYQDALKETVKSVTDGISPFDVVVLDQRMPGKTGLEVATEILKINPNQRIIFTSAYVKESLLGAVQKLNGVFEVMQKPFEMEAFVNTIEYKKYKQLEKLKVKVRTLKDDDPSNKELCMMLGTLAKIQRHDVWYSIGSIMVA